MRDRTNKQLAEKLDIIKESFNENGSVFELLTIVQERLNSIPIEPPVKPEIAEIEIVCPKNSEPTFGGILKSGTMVKEVWEAQDEGLSGKQTKKWKSIIVKCRNCDETHEYALTRNP